MTENISALVDGEIDEEIHSELLEDLCQDPSLQQRWQRYHLIRSAIRGECSSSLLRNVYAGDGEGARSIETSPDKPHLERQIFPELFDRIFPGRLNWAGGLGLAAGLSAIAAVGFISGNLVDFQLLQQKSETASFAFNDSGPTRWVTTSEFENFETKSINHLNETLLTHSENTGYPSMNGISNYARLVSYDR